MLHVRLFGGLALVVDGAVVAAPTARRARVLLGWLVLHPGMHDRRELAARLRPDVLDESAQASLRQAVWAARQALGAAGAAMRGTRTHVGLVPGPITADVWEVERLLTAGDVEGALALTEPGELLAGLDEEWVYDAREAYRARLAHALAAAGDEAERSGDLSRALDRTRCWVALDPLNEHAHRALVRRLAAGGDVAGAVFAYDRLVRRLREELAVGPSPETRQLVATIRAAATPAVPAQAGAATASPVPLRLPAGRVSRRFVGRERELRWFEDQWQRARRSGPVFAVVSGEAGIGKTRLVSEFSRRLHAGGAHVLYGSCSPDPLVAYEPFVVALRHYVASCPGDVVRAQAGVQAPLLAPLLPDLEPSARPAEAVPDRLQLFDAVVGLLTAIARARPLLLVLDDLHWADPGTALLLRHLVSASDSAPLLVVALYRPTDLGDAAADVLAELARLARVPCRELDGLDQGAVDLLLSGWTGDDPPPGLAAAVWKRTRGNPFFVEEVLEHLLRTGTLSRRAGQWVWDLAREDVTIPTGVVQVIRRRVERLSSSTRAVVAAGAVYGLTFPVPLVQAVLGFDDSATADAVDEAIAVGLLAESPETPRRCAFVHPLTRETVVEQLSATRRGALHRSIARVIQATGTASVAELAHHLSRAVPDGAPVDDTIRWTVAAAEDAMRQRAYEDAVRWFDSALALVPVDDAARRRDVFSRRGVALTAQWHVLLDAPRPGGVARVAK